MALKNVIAKQAAESVETEVPVVENTEEAIVTTEAVVDSPVTEVAKDDGLKDVEGETPRERALRLEVTRLKAERRETRSLNLVKGEEGDEPEAVSKAEAIVLNAFQKEAFDEFLEKYPQYETDDSAWEKFMGEFGDRMPILDTARRNKVPVTKKLIRERLENVHRAIGLDMTSAMEDGKRDLLKAQAAAKVAGTGFAGGEQAPTQTVIPRKRVLPKTKGGLASWVS